jgi:hypothetical protein
MGRTIPSFRLALAMEKEDWQPFRNALDKSDRELAPANGVAACASLIAVTAIETVVKIAKVRLVVACY